jgi:diguanylate cyclase (GGDEF)-like protein/PAS domain S-box-containing protein
LNDLAEHHLMIVPAEPIMHEPGLGENHASGGADDLTAIIETQNDIAAVELDPAIVMRIIAERTQRLIGADGVLVDMVDAEHLVCRATSGIVVPCQGMRFDIEPSLADGAIRSGEIQYCRDAETDPRVNRARCRLAGLRSMAAVPLMHMGKPVGVLKVVSSRRDGFEDRHFAALRLMAGLLGAALSHATEFEAKKRLLAERTEALSALREANERVRESEERFRGAFENAPIGMALVGLDGGWKQVNASVCRIIGYTEAELLTTNFQSITHPHDLDADLALVGRLLNGQIPSYQMEKRYFHKDGRIVWVLLSVSLVRDDAGKPLYFISQIQDITEAKRKEIFEADQRAVLERVAQDRPVSDVMSLLAETVERQVEGARASVLLLHDGEILQFAPNLPAEFTAALRPRICSIASGLSQRAAAADAMPVITDVAADPIWRDVAAIATKHGRRTSWASRIRTGEGIPLGLLVIYCRHDRAPSPADIEMLDTACRLATVAAEHHHTTRQLAHLVRHDPLTGLPNRLCFEDRLEHAMALARRNGRQVALFVLDIDHFKQVNDTLGHDAGDSLLQQFAHRLRGQLREIDTLARMGGDEFMLILPDLSGPESATLVATKLIGCLEEPFRCGGQELPVTSSIGIALFPTDADDSAALQRRADEQMYLVKHRGRNSYSITGS